MQQFPFYFKKPILIINEECTENDGLYADKSLALWKLKDIALWKVWIGVNLFRADRFLRKTVKKFIERKF
jgi:hypothetical protein